MVVEVEKSGQISDKYGCHPMSCGLIETSGSNYPHTMHDLFQYSKCDFTIFKSFWTCQEVEALQILSMVMSGSCDSGERPKLSQI